MAERTMHQGMISIHSIDHRCCCFRSIRTTLLLLHVWLNAHRESLSRSDDEMCTI